MNDGIWPNEKDDLPLSSVWRANPHIVFTLQTFIALAIVARYMQLACELAERGH
jgi:hypothetical protein